MKQQIHRLLHIVNEVPDLKPVVFVLTGSFEFGSVKKVYRDWKDYHEDPMFNLLPQPEEANKFDRLDLRGALKPFIS